MTAPAGRPTSERRPLFRHPWRVAIVTIGLVAVLNLGIIILANSDTSAPGESSLPVTIEAISPESGELTSLVDDVTVDLRDDLIGELVIDGVPIPDDQLDVVPELGLLTFRPGPGKELTELRAGDNDVVVHYWKRLGGTREDPLGSFGWRFRAAA